MIPNPTPDSTVPQVTLTKAHGLGNDFLIALEADNPGMELGPEHAIRWCDRHLGIGADGLLIGALPRTDADDRTAATAGRSGGTSRVDLVMTLFNADGSRAEISGNGIRCLAQAALRSSGRRDGEIRIATAAGVRTLRAEATHDRDTDVLTVEMGPVGEGPLLGPAALAVGAAAIGSVSMGNPHVVIAVADQETLDRADLAARRRDLQGDPRWYERAHRCRGRWER
ncbi:MAG: hypothetical protein R2698_12810 [Microthrixaceae bacterium]